MKLTSINSRLQNSLCILHKISKKTVCYSHEFACSLAQLFGSLFGPLDALNWCNIRGENEDF